MKKLVVKKDAQCMACLECVTACSKAFYKEFHQDLSCIQIVEKNGAAKPMVCIQCGKCEKACEAGAITQNPKTVLPNPTSVSTSTPSSSPAVCVRESLSPSLWLPTPTF